MVLTFSVPVENPMAPPRMIIATPQMESSPRARDSITITGAKAINMFTAWVVQISANTRESSGIKMPMWPENRLASLAITACSAPVLVSM